MSNTPKKPVQPQNNVRKNSGADTSASRQSRPPPTPPNGDGRGGTPEQRSMKLALTATMMRNAYERERTSVLMKTIVVLGGLLLIMVLVALGLAMRPVQTRFFVEDQYGRITSVVPVSQPMVSDSEVGTWMANAVEQANTFDFINYKQQLMQAAQNFTVVGWNDWYKALISSGNLASVKDNKMVASVIPIQAPTLVQSGVEHGTYIWVFNFPVQVTYQVQERAEIEKITFRVVVVRVPVSQSPSGLALQELVPISSSEN